MVRYEYMTVKYVLEEEPGAAGFHVHVTVTGEDGSSEQWPEHEENIEHPTGELPVLQRLGRDGWQVIHVFERPPSPSGPGVVRQYLLTRMIVQDQPHGEAAATERSTSDPEHAMRLRRCG